MLTRREYWEHRKYRNTIFGMWKSVRWWLHRVKKKTENGFKDFTL